MEEPADGIPDGVVGEKGQPQLFKLVNKGDSETEVVKLSIQGDGDFQLDHNECSGKPLAGKTTCEFTVVFTPQAPGTRIAALQVTAGGVILAGTKLVGTATKPALLKLSPNAADFGAIAVGQQSPIVTFTLINAAGSTTAPVPTIALVGPSAPRSRSPQTIASLPCPAGAAARSACASSLRQRAGPPPCWK